MKFNLRKNKWIILIIIAVLAGAVFFVARKGPKNIALNLNSKNSATPDSNGGDGNRPSDENTAASGNDTGTTEEITDENGETITLKNKDLDPNKNASSGGNEMAHITTEHCNTDCEAFANRPDYFEYCEQVCGITPIHDVSNCDGKDGIEKDYCLKDLGIVKSDTSICDEISDANVRRTCKNRVTQDLIEEQMSGGGPVD